MSSGNIVKLNVGGEIFQTSKSTLTKFGGFFKTMLETGVPIAKDESGAIFIDRDPKHFRLILNFMRDGDVKLPDSPDVVEEIQKEAQYYLLDGLVEPNSVPKKRFFARNNEELAAMIANSTEKVTLVCFYSPSSTSYMLNATPALLKYSGKVEFLFRESQYNTSKLFLHDKLENRVFEEYSEQLDGFIQRKIPDIDQY